MELKRETICEDTMEIVREYYRLNTAPLFSILSDDCVWLGPGNLLASGSEAMKSYFKNGFIMPVFQVSDMDFRLIDTKAEGQLMVLGQYSLFSDEEAQLINAEKQRATFCYRLEKGGWRLYHMHVSNKWSELVGEEIFPVQVSTQTYSYVKKMLKEKKNERNHMLIIKTDLANLFVDTNEVVYIEATDRDSILHMLNERKQVSRSMKELQEQLPPNFYRIHRSFYVNCDYVEKIERYFVILVTGETLPIPKMRYMQVREELTRLIEHKCI